jgi:hypothetical protein
MKTIRFTTLDGRQGIIPTDRVDFILDQHGDYGGSYIHVKSDGAGVRDILHVQERVLDLSKHLEAVEEKTAHLEQTFAGWAVVYK